MRHKYDLLAFLELETRGIVFSDYASNGYEPPIVWDFMTTDGTLAPTGYFRKAGVECAFEDLFTYDGPSNKTVYDFDGVLKWAAHNEFKQSNFFSEGVWVKVGSTVTPASGVSPTGENNAWRWNDTGGATHTLHELVPLDGFSDYTVNAWIKSNENGEDDFRLFGDSNTASIDLTATNSWVLHSFTFPSTGTPSRAAGVARPASNGPVDILIYGLHLTKTSLGGMQDNPDQLDPLFGSYVPTTSAPAYQRRNSYSYKGSSWVGPKCLIESSIATNEHVSSNDFSGWTTLSLTKVVDGPRTKLIPTATSGLHYITANIFTPLAATQYTVSVISKAAGYNFCVLQFVAGGINAYKLFDVQNGALGSTGVGFDNATITEIAPNEYLCTMTVTTLSTGSGPIRYWAQDSDSISNFSGDTTSGIEIQHTQCEAGTVASSRVPTGSSTVNRAAETLEISAANHVSISATMTVSGVSIWNKGEMNYADTGTFDEAYPINWQSAGNNYITWRLRTAAGTGQMMFRQRTAAVNDEVLSGLNYFTPGSNVLFNLASRSHPSVINGALDGVALTENSTPTALEDLSIYSIDFTSIGNMEIEKGALWALDIEDAGIEEATTEPYIMAGYVADGYVE